MFVRIVTPPTDTTPIISLAACLKEYREHEPSTEPERWAERVKGAEQWFERKTGRLLRRHRLAIVGAISLDPIALVAVPFAPIAEIISVTVGGATIDPASCSILNDTTIQIETISSSSARRSDVIAVSDSHLDWFTHDMYAVRGVGCDSGATSIDLQLDVGYATGAVPDALREALFKLVGLWSLQREAASPSAGMSAAGSYAIVPFELADTIDLYAVTSTGP